MPSRVSSTIGVATLYGQVRDELRGRRFERFVLERHRIAEHDADVVDSSQRLSQRLFERAVELDGVDEAHACRRGRR